MKSKKLLLLVTILMGMFSVTAWTGMIEVSAQDIPRSKVKKCAEISDSLQRLGCYDKLLESDSALTRKDIEVSYMGIRMSC